MRYVFNQQPFEIEGSIRVSSTSANTAKASPVNLRDPSEQTQLYFDPVLVRNTKEPGNSVEGKLVYEKKSKKDEGFPSDGSICSVSKQAIKTGDTLELSLSTSETRKLFLGLQTLYGVYDDIGGIPYGSETYVPLDSAARQLLQLLKSDPSSARMIGQKDNFALVKELLKLLTQGVSHEDFRKAFADLETGSLQSLSDGLRAEQLRRAAEEIESNLDNPREDFWQREIFERYQWIIGQIFSSPCMLFESKAYVGGKAISDRGGNLPDFLYQNKLTSNVSIVEIKTPVARILGKEYRNNCYCLSDDMSGAVNQALSYRQSLMREFTNLRYNSSESFEVFHPLCVIVIGNTDEFKDQQGMIDRKAVSTFENYRASLNGVTIITYDELLQRIKDLIEILSTESGTPTESQDAEYLSSLTTEPYTDDIPF